MLRIRKTTKTSVLFCTDDPIYGDAVRETIRSFAGTYESSLIEDGAVIVGQLFLGTSLPNAERSCFVKEIFAKFDTVLESFGGSRKQ